MVQQEAGAKPTDTRLAGFILIAAAALSVLAMGHHPTGAHAPGGVGA